jgi:hypothetical protein
MISPIPAVRVMEGLTVSQSPYAEALGVSAQ